VSASCPAPAPAALLGAGLHLNQLSRFPGPAQTLQHLAEMIGVTYQQAHKYERAINRVSAGRLYEIAKVLNAPITYFYEGLGEEAPRPVTSHQRMVLEIARNFAEIQNEKHQEAVSQLARVLAGR
jgi:transcriptional regulator with XRE-family HTH domain